MKTYANLSDRLKLKPGTPEPATYDEFMARVDAIIGRVTDGLSSLDFADTVFTRDAFDEGLDPLDIAEEILLNDCIGEQFLRLYLGQED